MLNGQTWSNHDNHQCVSHEWQANMPEKKVFGFTVFTRQNKAAKLSKQAAQNSLSLLKNTGKTPQTSPLLFSQFCAQSSVTSARIKASKATNQPTNQPTNQAGQRAVRRRAAANSLPTSTRSTSATLPSVFQNKRATNRFSNLPLSRKRRLVIAGRLALSAAGIAVSPLAITVRAI
jgi:hypothetical protein